MKNSAKQDIYILSFFIASCILLRLFLVFAIEIDHDESTYLVIANEWLKGGIPYIDYIDIKPIGIYALFAMVIALFGQSIIAIRVFTAIVIGVTAFFLYRAKKTEGASETVALMTGSFYILLLGVHHMGFSSNTEIFFNVFTATSLFITLRYKTPKGAFFVGLLTGLGFIIKYIVLFDCIAFALYYFFSTTLTNRQKLMAIPLMVLGGVFPFAMVNLYYYALGHYDTFTYVTFTLPTRYKATTTLLHKFRFVSSFYVISFPITVALVFSYRYFLRKVGGLNFWILRLVWPILVWLIILFTGKTASHYYVQAFVPFCFVSFDFWDGIYKKTLQLKLKKAIIVLAILIGIAGSVQQYLTTLVISDISRKNRSLRHAIHYMEGKVKPSDIIYSRRMILHFVTNSSPVQHFIHPSLYTNEHYQEVFSIGTKATFQKIMRAKPKFCFTTESDYPLLSDYLGKGYHKVMTYENGDILWEFVR